MTYYIKLLYFKLSPAAGLLGEYKIPVTSAALISFSNYSAVVAYEGTIVTPAFPAPN